MNKRTTLCYIEHDGAYLMLYRNKKKHDANQGKWIGIGGKFEAGETAEECLLREVYEETGLTLTKYHFHGVISFISDSCDNEEMYLYSATEYEGILGVCSEGELRWVDKKDVLSLPTWEGDKLFLQDLLAGREHIDLTLDYEGDKLVKVERNTRG